MAKIELRQEDFDFLKELQHELQTQTNDGNAQPVYWGVMETREVAVPDGCGDETKISHDGGTWDLDQAIKAVNECIGEYPKNLREKWRNDVDKSDIRDVYEFMRDDIEYGDIYGCYDFKEEDDLCRYTGAFLTKRACQKYIETCGYNHSRPHTYAMTAFRNYELDRLLKILKTMKFEEG